METRVPAYLLMAVLTAAWKWPVLFGLGAGSLFGFGYLMDYFNYMPDSQDGVKIHVERTVGEIPANGGGGYPYVLVTITNNRATPLEIKNLVCTLEGKVYATFSRRMGAVQATLTSTGEYVGVHKVLAEVVGEEHTLAPGATERRKFGSMPLVGTETGKCDWREQRYNPINTVITWPTLTAKGEELRDHHTVEGNDGGVAYL